MKFLKILAMTLSLSMTAQADPPSTHGMVVFGKNATYVSHLPMFHAPHDYQLVMKVSFSGACPKSFVTLDR
ncbi:MAG: hypothetical protein AB7F59_10530 [Bdellovibrionales bacterium]